MFAFTIANTLIFGYFERSSLEHQASIWRPLARGRFERFLCTLRVFEDILEPHFAVGSEMLTRTFQAKLFAMVPFCTCGSSLLLF